MIAIFFAIQTIVQHQQSAAQQQAFAQPITTEQFAVVGHNNDSAKHKSYFEFINLQGYIIIIELPAGDARHAIIYTSGQILGQDAYTQQVTATFEDVNGDGRVDMIVTVGDQSITFLNNGQKFVPPQP